MGLQLIRTITPPVGTVPIDPDWATDPASSPGFDPYVVPQGVTAINIVLKAFDDPAAGSEISLGAMVMNLATVIEWPLADGTTKLAETAGVAGKSAKLTAYLPEIPLYAVDLYPRITAAFTSVPAALERLEIWAGPAKG